MKIEIHAVAKFWVGLTLAHVEVLKKAADWHYDAVCQAAAKPGGFIFGWHNTLVFCSEEGAELPNCQASFRDLDTCLKILEIANRVCIPEPENQKIVCELRDSFHKAFRLANEKMSEIIFTVE